MNIIKVSPNCYIHQNDIVKITNNRESKEIYLYFVSYGNDENGIMKKKLMKNVYNEHEEMYCYLIELFEKNKIDDLHL